MEKKTKYIYHRALKRAWKKEDTDEKCLGVLPDSDLANQANSRI